MVDYPSHASLIGRDGSSRGVGLAIKRAVSLVMSTPVIEVNGCVCCCDGEEYVGVDKAHFRDRRLKGSTEIVGLTSAPLGGISGQCRILLRSATMVLRNTAAS